MAKWIDAFRRVPRRSVGVIIATACSPRWRRGAAHPTQRQLSFQRCDLSAVDFALCALRSFSLLGHDLCLGPILQAVLRS
jgi:hypothetical protein